MTVSSSQKFILKKDIVFQEIDGVVHILDQKKDAIVSLNETASFLWKKLSRQSSVSDLTSALTDTYALNPKRAASDVTDFIQAMHKIGFVTRV